MTYVPSANYPYLPIGDTHASPSSPMFPLLAVACVALVALKLAHVVAWSWAVVGAPLVLVGVVFVLLCIAYLRQLSRDDRAQREQRAQRRADVRNASATRHDRIV